MIRDRRMWAVIALAILTGLLAGVGFAVYALRVEEIRVTGLRTIDPRSVIEASRLRSGERILWIRLTAVTRRVEQMPAVATATVDRSLPNTVVIRVREREPLARLDRRADLAVDEEGRIFPPDARAEVPILEGWRGGGRPGSAVDEVSRTVLEAFRAFPEALRARAARITVGPPLTLWLTDGTEVRFGTLSDLARKATIALAVLEAESGRALAYVDVRAPSVPVSRLRDPPAPATDPAPTPAS